MPAKDNGISPFFWFWILLSVVAGCGSLVYQLITSAEARENAETSLLGVGLIACIWGAVKLFR